MLFTKMLFDRHHNPCKPGEGGSQGQGQVNRIAKLNADVT